MLPTSQLSVPTTVRDAPGATVARGERCASVELPTLLLIVAVYAGWLAITSVYGHWPLAIVAPIAVLLITLHSSLTHEIVHGHPTRWNRINRLFGVVPLSLWLPYERYRRAHLAHHIDRRLTDPFDDPESYYWTPEQWAQLSPITRVLLQIQQTLAGRILLGPFWSIGRFLRFECHALLRDRRAARSIWLEHLLWCVPVIVWVKLVCGIPLWIYFLAMVMPAHAIQLIRSFAEHRARADARERIAIVEDSWILGPLFLFNNLHSLHHEAPRIPWYKYNVRYRLIRDRLIAENGGLVYRTYFDVARRFLFRQHDAPEHPLGRVPVRAV
jgi:fatty acid desaturase